MAYGKFVWNPGGGATSYTFAINYTYSTKPFVEDKTDKGRAIDGTLRTYNQTLKKSWVLTFRNISLTQKNQFKTIKEAQVDIQFYPVATDQSPLFTGRWTNHFNFIETAPGLWTGDIQLEEI